MILVHGDKNGFYYIIQLGARDYPALSVEQSPPNYLLINLLFI